MFMFLDAASTLAESTGATPSAFATFISKYSFIIMIVLLVVVFYFFVLRPQKKQEKAANDMRNNLEVGDEVTTIGGIIGRVTSIKDETFTIETSRDKTKLRFLRSALKSIDVKAADTEQ